ncbi:hypothetical protein GH714_023737 [Hevea brasiliensis]|uniref:Myb-like domain-containing protein n=1 Tax=Hevea brasiliensis TaxID=3981 RepID=A0A6A6LAK5_HEVBR|nr:hypothetical protein GH714_023737 [Hevea brasiliensis]
MDKATEEEDKMEQNVKEDSKIDQTVGNSAEDNGKEVEKSKSKKRRRQQKFEMFKGFCEDIISKIMAQQEEMHNKLLEDMVRRDEEKLAREEAWKKQEMDRINKELELRAQEQALTGDRQTPNDLNSQSNPLQTETVQKKPTSNDKEDLGKRWPKDEVLALINLRSSLYNSNEDKEATVKAPLWERISQGMMELGYKRSAKRCKEKWENINKYFRKTKDVNKKRSVDSRTCPYFHQLSTLYNQGTLVAPQSEEPEKLPLAASSPETTRLQQADC